ncbi:hypothetical protein ACEU6E_04180 [Halorutilales archaeon Cl-col2-1]
MTKSSDPDDPQGRVFQIDSNFEIRLEDVEEYFEDPYLPDGIDDVDLERRNTKLIIQGVSDDDEISKYTPTAQIKASVVERIVSDDDEDEGRRWGKKPQTEEDEDEEEPEPVEFVRFRGGIGTVLQNTSLEYEMFLMLRNLALLDDTEGKLTAVTVVDGELTPVRVVDGEERPASVKVVGESGSEESGGEKNWRNNKYINESGSS